MLYGYKYANLLLSSKYCYLTKTINLCYTMQLDDVVQGGVIKVFADEKGLKVYYSMIVRPLRKGMTPASGEA